MNFQENISPVPSYNKTFNCFVYSKNRKLYKKNSNQKSYSLKVDVRKSWKNWSSEKFLKIHNKAPAPKSLYDEDAGLQPATLLRKRPQHV